MNKIKKKFLILLVNVIFRGTRFWSVKRYLLRQAGIEIGNGSKVVGPIHIGTIAKLSIGENCWIGRDLNIYGNGIVRINDNCDLAPNISFITGSHEIGEIDRRAGKGISYTIKIQKGSWIGANSTLMGNIVVNKGVIVGACSFVNKNVDENIIVAGTPAKMISKL